MLGGINCTDEDIIIPKGGGRGSVGRFERLAMAAPADGMRLDPPSHMPHDSPRSVKHHNGMRLLRELSVEVLVRQVSHIFSILLITPLRLWWWLVVLSNVSDRPVETFLRVQPLQHTVRIALPIVTSSLLPIHEVHHSWIAADLAMNIISSHHAITLRVPQYLELLANLGVLRAVNATQRGVISSLQCLRSLRNMRLELLAMTAPAHSHAPRERERNALLGVATKERRT